MEEKMITIPVEEYKKLLEANVRISAFADFVNREKYHVDREDCGKYLGFDVIKVED
ncbi:MAG: hypothetical protein HDR01_05865 [Lachnospiraceae bacterium]|nr:hypothetical protein [Lachnospiraceae bacterium]